MPSPALSTTSRRALAALVIVVTSLVAAPAHAFHASYGVGLLGLFVTVAFGVPLLILGIAAVVQLIKGTRGTGTKVVAWLSLGNSVAALIAVIVQCASAGRHLMLALGMSIPLLVLAPLGILFSVLLLRRTR
jgi:hypothetical protein